MQHTQAMMHPHPEELTDFRTSLLKTLPTCPFMATQELMTLMMANRLAQGTPLFAAAITDRYDLLPMLISSVPLADCTCTGHVDEHSRGLTALHGAAKFGCHRSARMLISLGADVNAVQDAEHGPGATPVHAAALEGDLAMVQLLVDSGADVNTLTWNTPLYAASMGCNVFHKTPQFVEVTRVLLDAGAEIDGAPVQHLFTPLSQAVIRADHVMLKLLLERGASVERAKETLGTTDRKTLSRFIADLLKKEGGQSSLPTAAPPRVRICPRPYACAQAVLAMEDAVRTRSENRAVARRERRDTKKQLYPTSMSPPSAPISIPLSKLSQSSHGSNRDLDWDDDCIVCHDRLRQCMMLPCAHTVMCMRCAKSLRASCDAVELAACCPVCSVLTTCLVDMSE